MPRVVAVTSLVAVAARRTLATGLFELPALGPHERPRRAMRDTGRAKVLGRLAMRLGAAQQHRVLAERRLERELVKGEAGAASLGELRARRVREAQRADGHPRAIEVADVIGDAADNDSRLAGVAKVLGDRLERDGRPVGAGSEEAFEDDLVRLRVRPAREEAVQLHEQPKVKVLRDRRRAARLLGGLAAARLDVNTLVPRESVKKIVNCIYNLLLIYDAVVHY